jgi:hypothetical protein
MGEKMIVEYEDGFGFKVKGDNEEDRYGLINLVKNMYLQEKKENKLSENKFMMRVHETVTSILENYHESSYVEEINGTAYWIVTPEFGFGTVEIPINSIDISF